MNNYAAQMMQANQAVRQKIMQGIEQSKAIQQRILGEGNKAMIRGQRQRARDVAAAQGRFIPFTEEDMK